MRRVLITSGIFPPDIGGPATYGEFLADELNADGFNVCVLTYSNRFRTKNLDSKYKLAKMYFDIADKRFKIGRTSGFDRLRARATVIDLLFLYDMCGIPFPEFRFKEPAQQKNSFPKPEMPKMPEIPELPSPPK